MLAQSFVDNATGAVFTVAVDHFIGYEAGLPAGLTNVPQTIARLVEGSPDAITMTKGLAKNAWEAHAGRVPLIVSSIFFSPVTDFMVKGASPEEAVCLGADANRHRRRRGR